jgi:hypothetical protein
MRSHLQGRAKELDERHGTELPTAQTLPPCLPTLQCENRAQEDGDDVREQSRILQQPRFRRR